MEWKCSPIIIDLGGWSGIGGGSTPRNPTAGLTQQAIILKTITASCHTGN